MSFSNSYLSMEVRQKNNVQAVLHAAFKLYPRLGSLSAGEDAVELKGWIDSKAGQVA